MQLTATRIALIASASLLCVCDNSVPSARRVVQGPSIQVITDLASGDRLICVGAIADGPCTASRAQAVISGAAKPDDISARWAGEGKVIVSVGSGRLEKSGRTTMDGKVTIAYR
ncbi:MAG: hypothetical protein GC147_14370 [Porphyrobacter sp.]|nr:hypothetical protein [Porphyrobacter sp.]